MGIGNGEFVMRRKGIAVTAGVCGGEREMVGLMIWGMKRNENWNGNERGEGNIVVEQKGRFHIFILVTSFYIFVLQFQVYNYFDT
jgi:hypothetical protein